MTDTTTTETEVDETKGVPDEQTPETVEDTNVDEATEETIEEEPETFPRDYVEKLRKENAGYREKAKKAEQYARELHSARVAATGRLADPSDLPFDPAHLEDMSKLEAAIDELLQAKPHLASRKPRGEIGQGLTSGSGNVDLAGILRQRA